MKLPGMNTPSGKVAYGAGAVAVTLLCVWQIARSARSPGLRTMPCIVVCDACGAVEFDRAVPMRDDGSLALPLACSKCGAEAVYVCYNCPACGEPLPVDPAAPPAQCKHCKADLAGLFERPPAESEP